jgi:3-mercaptopyruvate sulfurtransferase SseA
MPMKDSVSPVALWTHFRGNDLNGISEETDVPLTWNDSTLITYCGSGIWASPIYFVARLLGYRVRFYDASFQEWGNNEALPVAVTIDK